MDTGFSMGFLNPALIILNVRDLFLTGLVIRIHSFNNDEEIKSVRVNSICPTLLSVFSEGGFHLE